MAFGKTILYQDFHGVGVGNKRFFAEDINDMIMAMQGNMIISGCGVSVGGTTDLTSAGTHVVVAAGSAFVNNAVRTISSTNIDLSTAFNALAAGQSRLILIYINSSGSVTTISGDIATDGNQLPESSSVGWTPVDTTPIAWIYLTEADSIMSANQIRDDIIYTPSGWYVNGTLHANGTFNLWNTANVSERLTIDVSTDGIAKLYNIDDTGSVYQDIQIGHATGGSAGSLYYDASTGRWGFGTSLPDQLVHILGARPSAVTEAQFIIEGDDTDGAVDSGGAMIFNFHDGTGRRNAAYIRGMKENGISANYASYLSFATRVNGGSLTERMRINSDGTIVQGVSLNDNRVAIYTEQELTHAGTSAIYGIISNPNLTGGGGTSPTMQSIRGDFKLNNAGRTITDASIFYANNPTKTAGTITNLYGLYVAPQTVGGTNWGVYVENNDSYFNGDLNIAAHNGSSVGLKLGGTLITVTAAEMNQLATINSVTITNAQWGYLGALNQGLTTTSNVTFAQLTITGTSIFSNSMSVNATLRSNLIYPQTDATYNIGITSTGRYLNMYITGSYVDESRRDTKEAIKYDFSALDIVMALKPSHYRKIREQEARYGFIVEDVADVIDEPVMYNDDVEGVDGEAIGTRMIGLSYNQFIPINTKSIQELYSLVLEENKNLRSELDLIKQRVITLEGM